MRNQFVQRIQIAIAAAINIMSRFDSDGAIAQLGERYNGIVEVGGSIPPGSTIEIDSHLCPP